MAAVRKSLIVGGCVVATGWLLAMLFGACRGSHPGPADSPPPERHGSKPPPLVADGASQPTAAHAEAPPDAGTVEGDDGALRAMQQCSSPRVSILNIPDGGVVFNNAMTSADAGFIDRTQGIIDVLVGLSSEVRCCLEPWAEQHPTGEGSLVLILDLDPAGNVERVDIDAQRSNITEISSIRCVLDVARRGHYPESPTGSPTKVEYPLEVAVDPP